MANRYLVSEMIAALKDTGMIPSSDEAFTSARLIAVMNREQRLYLARLLISLGDAYQLARADVAIEAGEARYRIPGRAVVAGLKLVEIVGADGSVAPLDEVPRARAYEQNLLGAGGHYYIEGNELVFLSTPTAAGTIRFSYFRRLSDLVDVEEVGLITAINTATRVVTVDALPGDFSSSMPFDLVQANPHFDTLGADLAATVAGTNLTFAETLPEDLAEGDYVCLAGQTPICQAPVELHEVLIQKACVHVLKAKGDPKAQMAEADLAQMRDDAVSLLQRRVKSAPELVLNFNAPGWGRYRGRSRFRGS